ncbi:Gfo/Idh/MocA family oxidoreductase [Mycolicibacterium moriokaense]|uniref:Putative dehydrogenase n=1 Tax=Mycolicibacterium moriokaense TaxID=39691 RepID=A0A318H587_9MYCO|nr:Gfo/Idh/MocA family oxidoreductase [Mycolicibacterium moriokaense]PXW99127.1 putative dehydrogenase [Mycolicibacterium moriokaense]
MKRALVIGSGYRVRNAFLPALSCLGIRVVGVYSRSVENARRAGEPYGIPAVEDVSSLRPGDVDVVLVSVTVSNNVEVMQQIAHLAPGAALVMDTPGISRPTDLWYLPLYRRWAQVRVAEDFMNMPQYRLVNKVIGDGHLGDITSVSMDHMGYQYHALALIRSWLGMRTPRSARGHRSAQGAVDVRYRFDGVVAGVREPYRQGEGSFTVTGTRGSIAGHPMGHPVDATIRLERIENGELAGFRVPGLDTEIMVPRLKRVRDLGLEDPSEFNVLRVDGLCEVVSSLWEPDPVNAQYRLEDAMADRLVSAAVRRFRRVPAGNIVDRVDSMLDRLRTSTAQERPPN